MAKWLYAFMILSIMTIGIFLIFRFGYEPAPVGIMKPSYFSQPEEVGTVVFRRFYSPISLNKLVVFGIPPQPDWHRSILQGFLKAAKTENIPFDLILAEEQMPQLDLAEFPEIEVQTVPMNSPTLGELSDKINAAKAAGKRTLIYVPSVFSTHVLGKNTVNRYEAATGEHLFSITSAPLSLAPDQEYIVDPPCLGSERDTMGTSELGCTILRASRMIYRKKIGNERWVAIMNSPKPEDFLLMVAPPGQKPVPPPPPPGTEGLRTGESNR